MMHSKLSFLFSATLTCTVIACGSDDSDGGSGDDDSTSSSNATTSNAGGSNGSGGTSSDGGSGGTSSDGGSGGTSNGNTSSNGSTSASTTGGGGNACNLTGMGGTGGSAECTEYAECAQSECGSEYEECMGADFENGDYSGGSCESYMDCISGCQSGDECDTACVLDCGGELSDACESCLLEAGECGFDACPDEFEACNGDASTSTTTSTTGTSTTGGGGGTCEDMQACCDSIEGEAQDVCLSTVEALEGNDAACDVLLQSYQAAGQC